MRQSTEYRLAEVALMLLNASLGLSSDSNSASLRYIVAPNNVALTHKEVIERFVGARKPIECEVALRGTGVELHYHTSSRRTATYARAQAARHTAYIVQRSGSSPAERMILIHGVSQSIQLSIDEFRQLEEQYELSSVLWTLQRNTERSSATAAWIVTVRTAGSRGQIPS